MMMQTNVRQHGSWLVLGGMLYVPQALAYLDPATGSMIIQGVIGAIAGAIVVIRLYWHRFKAWLTGKPLEPLPKDDEAVGGESSPSERK